MNFPFTMSAENPNNIWMEEAEEGDKEINYDKAFVQFFDLYNYVASGALVYLLPSYGEFQDQVYVANLGIYLPHIKKPTIIVSNYKSPPRIGEDKIGAHFFKMMKYDVHKPETTWEGEADLKYLRDNIYIGGYGIRSDIKTYKWMAKEFDMEIIPIGMDDEHLYHFDCICFPLSSEKVLLCTELCDPAEVKVLEKHVEIIDVPADHAYNGITNCVRFENVVLCASPLNVIPKSDSRFKEEQAKVDWLTKVCSNEGMEVAYFNLQEYEKSGAMLSCMMMHLNYVDYSAPLY